MCNRTRSRVLFRSSWPAALLAWLPGAKSCCSYLVSLHFVSHWCSLGLFGSFCLCTCRTSLFTVAPLHGLVACRTTVELAAPRTTGNCSCELVLCGMLAPFGVLHAPAVPMPCQPCVGHGCLIMPLRLCAALWSALLALVALLGVACAGWTTVSTAFCMVGSGCLQDNDTPGCVVQYSRGQRFNRLLSVLKVCDIVLQCKQHVAADVCGSVLIPYALSIHWLLLK